MFQQKIEETIESIDKCVNVSDNIIIGGEDQADHDKKLEEVLRRLEKEELTANEDNS